MVVLFIIRSVISLYDFITFPLYAFTQKPWKVREKIEQSKAKPLDESDPHSPWLRTKESLPINKDLLPYKCDTLDQLFRESAKRYKSKRCLGYRQILEEKVETSEGSGVNKLVLSDDYHWMTYEDVDSRVDNISKGLLKCGIKFGDRIILYANTGHEWYLSALSLYRIGAVVTTLYTNLSNEEVVHAVNETQAKYIITNVHLIATLEKVKDKIPKTKCVILIGSKEINTLEIKENGTGFELISLKTIESNGSENVNRLEAAPLKHHHIAFIMYTSGSTGQPKGVIQSHGNVIAAIRSLTLHLSEEISMNDIYIAYLPLAHILEFIAESIFLSHGISIGYSSPMTLTDRSVAICDHQQGDITILKPTIFVAVPLVLERFKKTVIDGIKTKGEIFKSLFNYLIEYKIWWQKKGYSTPLLDAILFRKIRHALGGNIRILISGGAPLSAETQEFLRTVLSVKLLQGYGSTETCGCASLMDCHDFSVGRVGAPAPLTKVMLKDWPEGGYRATDKPYSRGEIIVNGDQVTMGYYMLEEETKDAFYEDNYGSRWFCTGDIAEMYPNGTIKIIDRKKDIVKLQNGEFISLGRIESILKQSPFVSNICVICDSLYNYPIALIMPNELELRKVIESLGIDNALSFDEICAYEKVIDIVKSSLIKTTKSSELRKCEIPAKIKLCSREWTSENGLLTPSMKVIRRNVYTFYKNDIIQLFQKLNTS